MRWYSSVLEHNFKVSRFLGFCLSSNQEKELKIWGVLSKDLLAEIEIIVDFVEVASQFPDSLDLVKNDLVYEIVRLVSDDYRAVQLEIGVRVGELRSMIPRLSCSELTRLSSELIRFESCRERLRLVLMNRNKNDGLWELVGETKEEITVMVEEKGKGQLVKVDRSVHDFSEWTRFDDSTQLVPTY